MSLTSFIYLELLVLKLDFFHTSSINFSMDKKKKQRLLTGPRGTVMKWRNSSKMASRLSSCPVYGPGTTINPHCSTLPSTARLPPNNRVHGPLRNSPDAKGHTAGSCHPLSLSSSHLPSPPLCRLLSTYFLTAGANRLPLLPPPPPMRSGNLSLRHWRTPPRWPPSAHQRNGFWQP
ncbi:hypothetical protein KOW79_015215 [Hemibagrus wyckioides]|uniref:Uncharacterized protein n=1 Tax=Hemibagrus wyckioides TaxID=337641 RepID=A0A9D3NER7_9TELE|nr:hypothetical protein KOW79_015215 [Hemibagrus wyckioides]